MLLHSLSDYLILQQNVKTFVGSEFCIHFLNIKSFERNVYRYKFMQTSTHLIKKD